MESATLTGGLYLYLITASDFKKKIILDVVLHIGKIQ